MPDDNRHRKIALCINQWSSEEAIYAWYWVKSHLLRGSQQDYWSYTLYIVHASSHKGKDRDARWDSGGPTTPDVRTSVAGLSAHIVELEGDAGNSIVVFAKKEKVDLLILGSKVGTNIRRKVLGSTTEYVVRRVDCPCLIIKPKLATGDTMRLKTAATFTENLTSQASSSPPARHQLGTKPSTPLQYSRRVAIMFDALPNARFLFPWAVRHVLMPSDTIFVVRCAPSRRNSGGKGQVVQDVSGSIDTLVAELLPGFSIATMYQLAPGDVKQGAISFVEEEGIDLLIAGRSAGRTRRQACTGVQVVSHLYKNVGCPMLLVKLSNTTTQRGVPTRNEDMLDDGLELDDTASEEGDTEDDAVDSNDETDDATALLHAGEPRAMSNLGSGTQVQSNSASHLRSSSGTIKAIKTSAADLSSPAMDASQHSESVAAAVQTIVQRLLASGHVQLHQPMNHFWVQVDPSGKVAGIVPLRVPPPEHATADTPTSMGTASLSVDISQDSCASLLPLLNLSMDHRLDTTVPTIPAVLSPSQNKEHLSPGASPRYVPSMPLIESPRRDGSLTNATGVTV